MDNNTVIAKGQIAQFCQRHHIRKLFVIGTALRKRFSRYRPINVLVEFHSGFEPAFEFFDMEEELSKLIGRDVVLNTPNYIPKRRKSFPQL